MSLGTNLASARKKSGLSQEAVAEKLGLSRQTISKWEQDETLPDICQSKKLSLLYHISLDALLEYDIDQKEIEQIIDKISDEVQQKINWTKVWSKKYPVLNTYPQVVRLEDYAPHLVRMLRQLRQDYGYNKQDACLVLKDILAQVWKL